MPFSTVVDYDSPDEETLKKTYNILDTFLTRRPPSVVRFRLPLTPPQGTDMPPKSTRHREVGTMVPAEDKPALSKSASKWTKTDLAKLGVDYQYDRFDDIVIGKGDVPAELLHGHSHPYINDTDL